MSHTNVIFHHRTSIQARLVNEMATGAEVGCEHLSVWSVQHLRNLKIDLNSLCLSISL